MNELDKVAKRLANEVGLSQTASRRVAKRLNELAKAVTWATPVKALSSRNAPRKRNPTGPARRSARSAAAKRRSPAAGRLRRNAA